MLISSIVFTLMNDTSRFGSDTEIGTAMVPIADVFTFTDGKAMPFRVPIVGAEGEISGPCLAAVHACAACGLISRGMPWQAKCSSEECRSTRK